MKKLNRKGFTLVELLAVIIILAIVVGITIPAVMTTTNNAKKSAFNTAASSLADWVDRQYQAAAVLSGTGLASADSSFTALCGTTGSSCSSAKQLTANFLVAGGLKSNNIALASGTTTLSSVQINATTGRSCVKLTAASGGDYPASKVACGGVCTTSQCTSTNT